MNKTIEKLFGITLFLSVIICLISFHSCENAVAESEVDLEEKNEIGEEGPFYAFPGAEGFGQFTTGGRGGKVYYVTDLSDDGSPGTLRYAVNQTGKRTIVFNVGGTIALNSRLDIRNGNLTIAGQSAPGGGITIKDYPVVINASNVIIRYIRFRMGDDKFQEADALEGRFQKDIIVDHCSFSWSTDECLTFYGNENLTVQWSIISESLKNSVHGKGAHGYGGIWGGKHASFHHNLLAHHDSRNPRLGESAGSSYALTNLVDLRNNVIYNWGNNSAYGGEAMNVNIVNCYYKPGPASPSGSKRGRIMSIDKNKVPGTEVYDIWGKFYIDGNVVEGSNLASTDNWTYGVYNQFHGSYGVVSEADKISMRMDKAHDIEDNVVTHTAQKAYELVLSHAGANLFLDEVDKRILDNTREGNYTFEGSNGSSKGMIDTQHDVGGWPVLPSGIPVNDSDKDGIPDDWEIANNLDPHDPADGSKVKPGSHYTYLEVYLNSLIRTFPLN